MTVKIFDEPKKQARQGEILFTRISELPSEGIEEVKSEKGVQIIGHSETGHHHVMEASTVRHFKKSDNPLIAYLQVITETPLKHLRPNDHTHPTILFTPGVYKINHQRQPTPSGWARVED